MEEKESSVQGAPFSSRPPESVSNLMVAPPHLKHGSASADRLEGGGGSSEIPFDEIDLKDPSSSYSPLASPPPPPGSALARSSPPFSDAPKRRRGRPPGSRNREKRPPIGELLSSTAGDGFTPYFTTVKTGEDVLAKVLSFPLNGAQGVCVLSATGTVSNVTIRPPGVHTGNSFTYEGLFEILSLTGSFVANDPKGKSKTGGLTISIAGANGHVIGGAVAGILMAASPIQMVLGSFIIKAPKLQKRKYTRRAPTGHTTATVTATTTVNPLRSGDTGWLQGMAETVARADMASGSPVGPSAEDAEEDTTTSEGAKDMQNLNMEPSGVHHEERNGSEHMSKQSTWLDDINVYPAGEV